MKLFFPLFLHAVLGGEQRRGTAFAAAFPGNDSAEVPHQQRRQNGLVRGSNKNNVVMFVEDLPDQDDPFTHRRELEAYITPDGITFIGDESFDCVRYLDELDVYGCKKGEYAACYYRTSTSKGKKKSTEDTSGEYHTTCWDYEKYGAPELGNSVGTSTDKYWAACAPCDCAPAITSQFPAPIIKVGKKEKKLQCPPVPTICLLDTDEDGIPDIYDNCPLVSNPDQVENGDYCYYGTFLLGIIEKVTDALGCPPPEVCLPDTDDDGVPDLFDNCPLVFNPGQDDILGDGVGDACRCDADKRQAALYLITDGNPAQTSWTLKERSGVLNIASGTFDQAQILYTIDMGCLDPTVCYELTISDMAEDDGGPYYQINFDDVIYGQPTVFHGSVQSILFGACTDSDNQQALLHLTTDGWGGETSWSFAQSGGAVLASGPPGYTYVYDFSYSSYAAYVISLGYIDPNACYAFTIFDLFGDGLGGDDLTDDADDGNYFIRFNELDFKRDVPFTGSSETILIGNCPACESATLKLTTDDSEETAWRLKRGGVTLASDRFLNDLASGTEHEITMGCFDPDACYEFTIFDEDGNGFSGNGAYSIAFNGEEYKRDVPFTGSSETILIGNCPACELATLKLTTDDSTKTAWELKRDGVTLASDFNLDDLASGTEHEITMGCFDPDACYEFTIFDEDGNGFSGNGAYSIEFDGEYSGTSNFGSSETLNIGGGGNCPAESSESMLTDSVAVVEKPIQVHTTLVSDATHVAQLSVSVPFDQHVTVDIINAQTGTVVATLFDGMISVDSPQVVSFDLGKDISTLQYKAEIKGENEAEKITLYLFKPDYQGK